MCRNDTPIPWGIGRVRSYAELRTRPQTAERRRAQAKENYTKNKGMRVLMFGWEFPPHIAGGLGTACYGMTR